MAAVGRRIFVAKTSFHTSPWGWVFEGDTVREGHALLEGREGLFVVRVDRAKFEFEPKSAAPMKRVAPRAGGR
jgi:hypothetical protein